MTEPNPIDPRDRLRPVVAAELARGNRVKHGWHQEQFDVHWGSWWVLELEHPIDLEALATEVELPPGVHTNTRDGSVGVTDNTYMAVVSYRAPTPPAPPPTRRARIGNNVLLGVVVAAAVIALVVGTLLDHYLTRGRYTGGGAYRLGHWLVAAVFLAEMALLVALQLVGHGLGALLERVRGRGRRR